MGNGPRPAECLAAVRDRGWAGIRGNTDQAIWDRESHPVPPAMAPIADWTRDRLAEEDLAWLRAQPLEWRDGEAVALVHAVPGDLWTAVRADASDQELRSTYGPLGVRLAVYCHIHIPFVRGLDDQLTVANTGSVGLPFDGDPRASYLLIEDGALHPAGAGTTSSARSTIFTPPGIPPPRGWSRPTARHGCEGGNHHHGRHRLRSPGVRRRCPECSRGPRRGRGPGAGRGPPEAAARASAARPRMDRPRVLDHRRRTPRVSLPTRTRTGPCRSTACCSERDARRRSTTTSPGV